MTQQDQVTSAGEPVAGQEEGTDVAAVPVEFEGIGVAYITPEALAAVLHHARKLREAEAGQGENGGNGGQAQAD